MRLALPLVLACATFARADDGVRREAVNVGQTIERDVGFAIGVACDHPDVVGATMKTSPATKTNVLALTGKRAGKTVCRAGLDPNRSSVVFEIVVTAPPARQ